MSALREDPAAFTRALAAAMATEGLTSVELARRTDTTQGYISLLAGGRRSPSQETAEVIAAAFGLSLPAFIARHGSLGRPGRHPR